MMAGGDEEQQQHQQPTEEVEADSNNNKDEHLIGSTAEKEEKLKSEAADILRAVEVVERDSVAVAHSFTSLFDSLRLALSEATSSSIDHMQCFGDAAGRIQESALDAATKGNRYINSCLRLNEEMKGMDSLAAKLKMLRKNVDALDSAVSKLL